MWADCGRKSKGIHDADRESVRPEDPLRQRKPGVAEFCRCNVPRWLAISVRRTERGMGLVALVLGFSTWEKMHGW